MYGLGYGGGAGYGAGYGAGFGGTTTRCCPVPQVGNCVGAGIISIAVLILIALGVIFTF